MNTNEEISNFNNWCLKSWGQLVRNSRTQLTTAPLIQSHVDFKKSSYALKALIAERMIIESCSRIMSYADFGDIPWYVNGFALELKDDGINFKGREVLPLRAALLLAVNSSIAYGIPSKGNVWENIRAGGGAMSAMYLLAQLEFLFRNNSRYLNTDGIITKTIPKGLREKAGLEKRNLQVGKERLSNIQQAFQTYLFYNRTKVGKRFQKLDKMLNIGSRLKRIRMPAMHGELLDPSGEARFYALLIAIFYYGEC